MSAALLVDYIDEHREEFGVEPICTVLRQAGMPIAPRSYHAARARPPSARAVSDVQHLVVIRKVHQDNSGVYGVRKMHAELHRRGHRIARCTVHRLMRADGLRGIGRAKGPRITVPGTGEGTRTDHLGRNFVAEGLNRDWVADITYCRTFAASLPTRTRGCITSRCGKPNTPATHVNFLRRRLGRLFWAHPRRVVERLSTSALGQGQAGCCVGPDRTSTSGQ
ncbi:IS3 family transposase [Nocardioides sp. P5_C9_2]